MHGGLGGYCIHPIFALSDVLYPALIKFTKHLCVHERTILPTEGQRTFQSQVPVPKSLQVTAEMEYPKCNTRRSVARCSRDVANGSMRMEASSYTSTSTVTRQSSCLAFPCRALPDQKCLLSSCIANSFLHIRSRITKKRGERL